MASITLKMLLGVVPQPDACDSNTILVLNPC
nr:MAG TPA: hypothetical protein [Crassvirales sp.]